MISHLIVFITLCIFTCYNFALNATAEYVCKVVEEMTLEEKIGQLLMVHFKGESINEEARVLVQNLFVGGIIYYNWANGLHSPSQVRELSADLQSHVQKTPHAVPLLIAVDQEGGPVSRLKNGFTVFFGNEALGRINDRDLAERCAFASGQELRDVGVNFNLAPVVDVNYNSNSPIAERTYSSSPEVVCNLAKSAIAGYRAARIITAIKHFPGLGSVEIDTHEGLPITNKTKEELAETDLFPFVGLAHHADVVMTAHLIATAFDSKHCATLSKKTLDTLRNEIGFTGMIISDSLIMEGLLKNCGSIDEAAICALDAGCDMILLGGKQLNETHNSLELNVEEIRRIHQSLVKAVKDRRLSENRINEALEHILILKSRYGVQ